VYIGNHGDGDLVKTGVTTPISGAKHCPLWLEKPADRLITRTRSTVSIENFTGTWRVEFGVIQNPREEDETWARVEKEKDKRG